MVKGIDLMAEYTLLSKYSQRKDDGSLENWDEIVDRIYSMHKVKLFRLGLWDKEIEDKLNQTKELEKRRVILSSQRGRQFASISEQSGILKHEVKMYNCASTYIDRTRVFAEIIYTLLCGCGVGYSLHKEYIDKLPEVASSHTKLAELFVVEDSIEGWADSIDELMRCIFSGERPNIDFSLIRPEGSLIDGKFLAPGNEKLMVAHDAVWNIAMRARGRKLKSLEIHDILCWIASSVMSGGVRRSAMIALFDKDDTDMLNCKREDGWWKNPETWQRQYANNSILVSYDDPMTIEEIRVALEAVKNYGEPAFVRVGSKLYTVNPCGEIVMLPMHEIYGTGFAFCNLVEINAQNIETEEEFLEACYYASFIATVQSLYTDFKYLGEATKHIAERDRAIGVSITGVMSNAITLDGKVLSRGAKVVRLTNGYWAKKFNINTSRACTTIKPSGNASTILGLYYSGIHPAHSERYIRSIQIRKTDPEYIALKDTPLIQPAIGVGLENDALICFPIEVEGDVIRTKDNVSTHDHLKVIALLKHAWVNKGVNGEDGERISNNVSATVQVGEDDWNDVAAILYAQDYLFTGLSFIPKTGDSVYPNAPFRSVNTEEREKLYNEILSYIQTNEIDFNKILSKKGLTESGTLVAVGCSGGACEI